MVAPCAAAPAAWRATTSAWFPARPWVAPANPGWSSAASAGTTTAPTQGRGDTERRDAAAAAMACRMRSASLVFTEWGLSRVGGRIWHSLAVRSNLPTVDGLGDQHIPDGSVWEDEKKNAF